MKSFGLIALAEEITKHPSVDSVVWSLVVALMKMYNEKEHAEQGKIFEEKRSRSGLELSPVVKERNRLGKGIKGVVTSWQDPTPVNFQL